MKLVGRYLGRTVGLAILLAAAGLVALFAIFTLLDQLQNIKNDYTAWKAMTYVGYSLPRMFYETMPYAILVGCMTGLGLLAGSSELIVMRASGVSTWQISLGVMQPALLFVLAGLLVGELVLPDFERTARIIKEDVRDDLTPRGGFWYREDDLFLHFNAVSREGELRGINLYQVRPDSSLRRTLWADSARYVSDGSGSYWMLRDIIGTNLVSLGAGEVGVDGADEAGVDADGLGVDNATTNTDFRADELKWRTSLTPDILNTEILVEPGKMSILELSRKIGHMKAQDLSASQFQLGFYAKLFQPLACLSLVLVAISFVFGPLRETTMGMRIVTGLVVSIVFKFVQDLLAPASLVFGFSPMVATLTPVLLCLLLGFYLLRRAQ